MRIFKYIRDLHTRRIHDIKWAHEAHVADIQAAHERELEAYKRLADVLAEQVEYLRFQLNARPQTGFVPHAVPTALLDTPEPTMFVGEPGMSETERELRELFLEGHMEEDELQAALQALGLNNTDDDS